VYRVREEKTPEYRQGRSLDILLLPDMLAVRIFFFWVSVDLYVVYFRAD
jgi:hypothetical protein